MLWVKCKTWLITSPVCSHELCVLSFYNMILWNLTAVGSLITCSITLITYQNMWIFQKCDNVSGIAGDIMRHTCTVKENIARANTLVSFCHTESSSTSWLRFMAFFVKSILLYATGHAVHTVFTFYKLLSQECMKKYALRLSSQVLSCCLCFERHFFSQGPQEKKIIWNVFHSMSHTRWQQINKACCLAAETQRNVTHQSSDDGNGTTGMLNFSGWCMGAAGVALDPFKAFLYVCYQLCVKSLPFFGI